MNDEKLERFNSKTSLEDMDVSLDDLDEVLDGLFYVEDDATTFLENILLKFIPEEDISNFNINFSVKEEINEEKAISFKIESNIEQLEEKDDHLYKTLLNPAMIGTKNISEFLQKIDEQVNLLATTIYNMFTGKNRLEIG